MTYFLITFLSLITYKYQLKDLILLVIKAACYANPGAERNFAGSRLSILGYQIHQLTIKYHFEHTNLDILLKPLFQSSYKLFLSVCNLHQQYLLYLSDSKNLPFWVTTFYRIFPNHPYIPKGQRPFATIK